VSSESDAERSLRPNQPDSTESKIGSLRIASGGSGEGTITRPAAGLASGVAAGTSPEDVPLLPGAVRPEPASGPGRAGSLAGTHPAEPPAAAADAGGPVGCIDAAAAGNGSAGWPGAVGACTGVAKVCAGAAAAGRAPTAVQAGPGLRPASETRRRPVSTSSVSCMKPACRDAAGETASCAPRVAPAKPAPASRGGVTICRVMTSSGSQTRPVRPPNSACWRRTLTPWRTASLATTIRPTDFGTSISAPGGCSSCQLA